MLTAVISSRHVKNTLTEQVRMIDFSGKRISALPGSIQVRAMGRPLCVSFAEHPGMLQTLEGPVAYQRGDALLSGPSGEKWPVERERFFRTYSPVQSSGHGEPGMFRKKPLPASALRVSDNFTVTTLNGAVLTGKARDWILQYEDGDYGVVDADIFPELYSPAP